MNSKWLNFMLCVAAWGLGCGMTFAADETPAASSSGGAAPAHAATGTVRPCKPVNASSPDCECDTDLSKITIKSPKGMKLVASEQCQRAVDGDIYSGIFYFKGEQILSGQVIRSGDNPIFGDAIIWFEELRFTDDSFVNVHTRSTAIQKFKLPELTENSFCWYVDATIKVKAMKVIVDDTDYGGIYPTDFEVLKASPPHPCKMEW